MHIHVKQFYQGLWWSILIAYYFLFVVYMYMYVCCVCSRQGFRQPWYVLPSLTDSMETRYIYIHVHVQCIWRKGEWCCGALVCLCMSSVSFFFFLFFLMCTVVLYRYKWLFMYVNVTGSGKIQHFGIYV